MGSLLLVPGRGAGGDVAMEVASAARRRTLDAASGCPLGDTQLGTSARVALAARCRAPGAESRRLKGAGGAGPLGEAQLGASVDVRWRVLGVARHLRGSRGTTTLGDTKLGERCRRAESSRRGAGPRTGLAAAARSGTPSWSGGTKGCFRRATGACA